MLHRGIALVLQGYTTTTMPTTWMNDSSKVLCAYEHASLLEGTMVLVTEDAPLCCCPRAFSHKDFLGKGRGPADVLNILVVGAPKGCSFSLK